MYALLAASAFVHSINEIRSPFSRFASIWYACLSLNKVQTVIFVTTYPVIRPISHIFVITILQLPIAGGILSSWLSTRRLIARLLNWNTVRRYLAFLLYFAESSVSHLWLTFTSTLASWLLIYYLWLWVDSQFLCFWHKACQIILETNCLGFNNRHVIIDAWSSLKDVRLQISQRILTPSE